MVSKASARVGVGYDDGGGKLDVSWISVDDASDSRL